MPRVPRTVYVDIDAKRLIDPLSRGRGGVSLEEALGGSSLPVDLHSHLHVLCVRRVGGRWTPVPDWPGHSLTFKIAREHEAVQRGAITFCVGEGTSQVETDPLPIETATLEDTFAS